MIFSKRKITIVGDKASIDKPIVLYRGDREIEIQFEIVYEVIRYRMSNTIEDVNASFGQLVIQNNSSSALIITDISPTSEGVIIFKFTKEMIDEINEIGAYNFQIRLFDDTQISRITTPIIENGITIKEPLSIYEGDSQGGSAEAGVALTGAARVQQEEYLEPFDEAGNYNETTWATGDIITSGKLNKLEDGITGVNQKVEGITVPTKTSQLTNDSGYTTETYVTSKIAEAQLGGGEVDLSGYVTKETGNASQITFSDGQTFQAKLDAGTLKGDKGDKGEPGEQGPAGANGQDGLTTAISVNGTTYTQVDGMITLPNYPTGSALRDISDGEYFIFSDETTTMSYTITNELSNAKNSNNISSINEGMPYTSTITANSGYTLENITVTMGGTDITSTAVSGNTITINSVTGNIVITVTTTQDSQEPGGETQEIISTGLINSLNDITYIQSIDNTDLTYFDLKNSEFTVFAKCSRTSTSGNYATALGGTAHPLTLQIGWDNTFKAILRVTRGENTEYPSISVKLDTTLYDEVGENLFIAVVGNGSTIEYYVNNIKQSGTLFYGEGTYTPPTSLSIGGDNKKVTWLYYNRVLSSDELTQNYTALGGVL